MIVGVKWKSAYSGLGMDEQTEYEAHVAAANEANKGMPAVMVSHGGAGEGSVAKDIRMENFSISMGGRELINEASVTLAYGRRYGTL
jgi:ATP-binding cassette subfamily F protein 3